MKAVELIDSKIAELRAVRREVVKGERRFSKESELDKANDFKLMLDKFNIPYEEFEFGCGIFIKITDEEAEKTFKRVLNSQYGLGEELEKAQTSEDLGDVGGQTFDPNC